MREICNFSYMKNIDGNREFLQENNVVSNESQTIDRRGFLKKMAGVVGLAAAAVILDADEVIGAGRAPEFCRSSNSIESCRSVERCRSIESCRSPERCRGVEMCRYRRNCRPVRVRRVCRRVEICR